MPKVQPINGNKSGNRTTPGQAEIDKIVQATEETNALIESNQQATIESISKAKINLPAFLRQTTMPAVSDRQQGGFVGFASTQSQKWNEQQAAGLTDGQIYLFHQTRYIPLKSLNFFLLCGESYQTLMVGKQGNFLWVSKDLNEKGPTDSDGRSEPHYVMLILVELNGVLIPIKGDFRGTKSGGMENCIRAVEAAGNPDWLKLSDQHKTTSAFPQPFGRVFHRITTKMEIVKSGRMKGSPYYRTVGMCSPATVSQMQLLYDAFNNEDFVKSVDEAKVNYDARVDFLDNIAKNGPAKAS